MRYSAVIASAIAAASVVAAAPLEKRAYATTWVIDVVTSTSTVYGVPAPSSSPVAATPSPVAGLQRGGGSDTTLVAPPPASTTVSTSPAPPPPATTHEAPPPAQTQPTSAGSCGAYNPNPDFNTPTISCGISVLDTVNKWRKAYGKSELAWSSNLAEGAWHTLNFNGGGPQMQHPDLYSGAYGETITPGYWDTATLDNPGATQGQSPFEIALMGWLCEVKSDIQLQETGFTRKNQCGIVSETTFISGSANLNEPTGHHDIFISDSYKSIACLYKPSDSGGQPSQWAGQWTCDFGY